MSLEFSFNPLEQSSSYHADEVRKGLLYFIKKMNLKPGTWAKEAGISEGTLRNFLTGRSNTLSYSTLRSLAHAANVEVSAVIERTAPDGRSVPVLYTISKDQIFQNIDPLYQTMELDDADKLEFVTAPYLINIPHGNVFASRVVDNVSDEAFPPLTTIFTIDSSEYNLPVRDGDILLLMRQTLAPNMLDSSDESSRGLPCIREAKFHDNILWLHPCSKNPNFGRSEMVQATAYIENMDSGLAFDTTYETESFTYKLTGIVVSSYQIQERFRSPEIPMAKSD
jgi:transcriptional regulator with XRE-family HTH domain